MAALAGAALLALLCLPHDLWAGLPDLCLFHRFLHLPCPTCGLTRSWAALLHGEFGASFRFHLLGPPLLAGLAIWGALRLRASGAVKWPRPLAWILAILWVGYAVGRMAGCFPWPPA